MQFFLWNLLIIYHLIFQVIMIFLLNVPLANDLFYQYFSLVNHSHLLSFDTKHVTMQCFVTCLYFWAFPAQISVWSLPWDISNGRIYCCTDTDLVSFYLEKLHSSQFQTHSSMVYITLDLPFSLLLGFLESLYLFYNGVFWCQFMIWKLVRTILLIS